MAGHLSAAHADLCGYPEPMLRLVLALLALALVACPSSEPAPVDPVPDEPSTGDWLASTLVGDWRAYPDPGSDGEWESEPLDDARWMRISAELACIGRAHHGDPEAHRAAMRQVLAHHKTSAKDVMDYGITINEDGDRARELGAKVSDAAQTCR